MGLLLVLGLGTPGTFAASYGLQGPSVAHAQDNDASRRAEIISRYKGMLESNPKEGFVFKQLLKEVGFGQQLERLIEEYQGKAAKQPQSLALQLILGHLLKSARRFPEALDAYDKAVAIDARSPDAWLGRGLTLQEARRNAEAQEAFEKALALEKDAALKQEILRKLADIAFARRDWDAADRYYTELIRLDPGNEYLRVEYAEVLTRYKRYEQALTQYEEMKRLAGRNVKQRLEAMKYIGDVYVLMGKSKEAVDIWRQAMIQVTSDSYVQRELEQRIIDVYRDSDDLTSLIAYYVGRWKSPDHDQVLLLAGLYDEVGKEKEAMEYYRLALKKNGRSVDARLRIIRLLERRGETKEVIKEYQALIKADASQTSYGFELAELYWREGDKRNAMSTLAGLERKGGSNAETLTNIAELYLQWGAREQALKLYQTLVRIAPGDPTHLISLGEFHWVDGQRDKAVEMWKRIPSVMPIKAEGYAELGQVYADHSLVDEAVVEFEKAIKLDPDNDKYYRQLAQVYERSRRTSKAIDTWQVVLAKATQDHHRREARSRIIQILSRQGTLRARLGEYKQGFEKQPPDLEAGYFLGESYIVLKDFGRAEAVFAKLMELTEGGSQALISLNKIYTETNEHKKNIEILRQLAKSDPLRAKEYYHMMAELSLKLYEDDQALELAKVPVDLNPNDANAHARLGRIYRQMQDLPRAAAEYRTAIDLDNLAFQHYFELAEIYQAMDQVREADALYRTLIRKSRDETDIQRAARKSVDINDSLGTLEELEKLFVPLLAAQPPKKIYPRMLIELYDRMTRSLIAELAVGAESSESEAAKALREIARRALGPLLVSLNDDDAALRQMTIRILGDLGNGNAALPLAKLVEDADPAVRVQAALAVGKLADPKALAPMIRAVNDEDRTIRQIAVWALGRMGDKGAVATLEKLLTEPDWSLRALAAIALGRLGGVGSVKKLGPLLASPAARDARSEVRVAAAWSLGAMGSPEAHKFLVDAVNGDPDANVQRMAAWGLGNVSGDEALASLVRAYWGGDAPVRIVAGRALLRLGADARGRRAPYAMWEDNLGFFDHRTNTVDVGFLIDVLLSDELLAQPSDGHDAIVRGEKTMSALLVEQLGRAEGNALVRMLGDLDMSSDHLSLGELTAVMPEETARRTAVQAALTRIGEALAPKLVPLLKSKDPLVRAHAAGVLGKAGDRAAVGPLIDALGDEDKDVRRRAALALGMLGEGKAVDPLVKLLQDDYWATRANAARALGMLGEKRAKAALVSALDDRFQWVQEGAAEGLGQLGDAGAVQPLVAHLDKAAPSVKVEILRALSRLGGAEARKALEKYRDDPDPQLRDAAGL